MTIPPADPTAAETPKSRLEPPAPLDGFAPEEFKTRRERLRAACPDGLILIRGATEADASGAAGTYRQNSSFFYLTGVDTPGALLVLLPESVPARAGLREIAPETREILFLPARNPTTETWTGAQLAPGKETEAQTGIAKVADSAGFWGALQGWLSRHPILYTLAPYGERAYLTPEYALMQEIGRRVPVVQFRDAGLALARQRMVKSPAEIERIRQAIAITVAGQETARQLVVNGAGRWEYEIEARIYETFRSRGATLAFASIVGGGVHSTVLHYEDNRCQLRAGEVVVVDIGARIGHYCGDLTRTYPVSGVFSDRQREIYELVLAAHHHAVANFRTGEDSEETVRERNKAFLKESPLRALDSSGKEQTMDAFMPHGLSHHLGLDVHDASDRFVLYEPGHVLTIEPGIYIPSEGIGARLEDDYLVTPDGLERLGPPLTMELT